MDAGRELDALVAEKVMGWRWFSFKIENVVGGGRGRYLAPHEERETDKPWKGESAIICIDAIRGVPRYSTDIAAAWLVVEKMRERMQAYSTAPGGTAKAPWPNANYLTLTERGCFGVEHGGGYAAAFVCLLDTQEWIEHPGHHGGALADTAPQAICLAALAAIQQESTHAA